MLMALLLMSIFGGGASEIFTRVDFRVVDRVIEDADRAEAAAEVMQRMNGRLADLTEERNRLFDELDEIDKQRDTPGEMFDAVFDRLWQARGEAFGAHTEDVFVLRQRLTREEWDAAFGNIAE